MNVPRDIDNMLLWWIITIFTDASTKMYGAYDQTNKLETKGFWSPEEQLLHINVLELKACEIGVKTFCKNISNVHVRLYTDNTTSCAYINNFGGKVDSLNTIARNIWFWCIDRKIHLSACHVLVFNGHADRLSRTGNDDLEWSLDKNIFRKILSNFPRLTVDLFASRLNAKLSQYVCRFPDPNAMAIDAFSLTWDKCQYYIFPPFSLLSRILQKVEIDKSQAVIVAPIWATQAWWPKLTKLIRGPCFLLPKAQQILKLEHKPGHQHPLNKMSLAVFNISRRLSDCKEYQNKQVNLSLSRGETAQNNNMKHILRNGWITVKERQIPLIPL